MKKSISSVGLMWIGLLFSALAILMMFIPSLSMMNGKIYNASQIFFNSADGFINGSWPTFVGYMLIVVALIEVFIIALPPVEISIKVEKIVLISAVCLTIVGAVIVMLTQLWFSLTNGMIDSFSKLTTLPGPYLTLAFSIVASVLNVLALRKDL
ncbi:MAG: hypothetical protein ACI31G_04405 [Bacilli bacterium]